MRTNRDTEGPAYLHYSSYHSPRCLISSVDGHRRRAIHGGLSFDANRQTPSVGDFVPRPHIPDLAYGDRYRDLCHARGRGCDRARRHTPSADSGWSCHYRGVGKISSAWMVGHFWSPRHSYLVGGWAAEGLLSD